MEKKTPLYDRHVAAGGKMVPFGGFLLPVQYAGVIEEHMAVRQKAGLFDVSHMGEVFFSGPDALKNLNALLANDFTNLAVGRVRYTPLLNDNGGIVDDMIVYCFSPKRYMLVPNAANRQKVVEFLSPRITGDCVLDDASDNYAQLALQGPRSREILAKLTDEANIPTKYYSFVDGIAVAGTICLVSQTGYTGEHGYEIYCAPGGAVALWNALLDAGSDVGLIPCGLGARDTLRLEAGMPLYGHEMNDEISPLEAGLDFAVKLAKDDFVGKAALVQKGEPARVRVGLKLTGRGIAREHCPVFADGRQIGETTSGTHLPYLNAAYAMALVERAYREPGTALEVDVRGRRIAAETVPLPFYKRG